MNYNRAFADIFTVFSIVFGFMFSFGFCVTCLLIFMPSSQLLILNNHVPLGVVLLLAIWLVSVTVLSFILMIQFYYTSRYYWNKRNE